VVFFSISALAHGGWGSAAYDNVAHLPMADAYVMEIGVNKSPKKSTLDVLGRLPGPKLIVALMRSCASDKQACVDNMGYLWFSFCFVLELVEVTSVCTKFKTVTKGLTFDRVSSDRFEPVTGSSQRLETFGFCFV
jgi:hypothetical protein